MLDTVKINHVQHISFTQSRLTDAVSVILSELLSYEHPSNVGARFSFCLNISLPPTFFMFLIQTVPIIMRRFAFRIYFPTNKRPVSLCTAAEHSSLFPQQYIL